MTRKQTIILAAVLALLMPAVTPVGASAKGHGHGAKHGHNSGAQNSDEGNSPAVRLCPRHGGTVTIKSGDSTFQKRFRNHGQCVSYFAHHPGQTIVSQPGVSVSGTLTSAVVTQGVTDTFTGHGFMPGETVDLHLGSATGALLGSGITNTAGTVTITFTIPAKPAGKYPVYAAGLTSGRTTSSTFQIVPTLSAAPSSGIPGSGSIIMGTGYPANTIVTVFWNCSTSSCSSTAPLLGSVVTNANGDFGGSSGQPGLIVTIPALATVGATYSIGGIAGTTFARTMFTVTG